jgi:hypothetical protein
VVLLLAAGWAVIALPPLVVQQGKADANTYLNAITATRATVVQAIGGLAVLFGVAVAWLTLQQNQRAHAQTLTANQTALEKTLTANREALDDTLATTRRGQVTDRFGKAIEQLGSDKLDVRVGGVYALEQIASDSAELRPSITEVLTAFVRRHAAWHLGEKPLWESGHPDADIAAVIAVLCRRDASSDRVPIDLSFTDLGESDFSDADLRDARLSGTRFLNAKLIDADLRGARLWYTVLETADARGARFDRADLRNVSMNEYTQLEGASYRDAILIEIYANGADFSKADLSGAHIQGVHKAKPAVADRLVLKEP